MIDIRNLNFSLNKVKILNDINVTFNQGEIIGIIGKSGSGKTALLKAIAGLLKVYSGSITVENQPLKSFSRKEFSGKISHLLHVNREEIVDDTLYNSLISARKAAKKFLNPYTEVDIQVTEHYISQFQLKKYKTQKMLTLPQSIFKNAVIAHAFIKEAAILLLDNPTSDQDINSTLLLQKSLQRYVINGDKLSIIASNDLNFISQTADRIILLDNGSMAADGKSDMLTSEMIKKYFNVDVLISRNIYNGKPNVHLTMES
ncbi:MAG: ABC transporter ATP-binding protein [Spirochaetes bacterium]|jgi:iron complex transport system ATP-binding protein|nr:ABC transporter ATP-binding protein [Spirochaetota bacterium]